MTNSLMRWHLARDDQKKLAKFCDRHQVDRIVSDYDADRCFTMTTIFDNGGWIKAELQQGVDISDHYQVVNFGLGAL